MFSCRLDAMPVSTGGSVIPGRGIPPDRNSRTVLPWRSKGHQVIGSRPGTRIGRRKVVGSKLRGLGILIAGDFVLLFADLVAKDASLQRVKRSWSS